MFEVRCGFSVSSPCPSKDIQRSDGDAIQIQSFHMSPWREGFGETTHDHHNWTSCLGSVTFSDIGDSGWHSISLFLFLMLPHLLHFLHFSWYSIFKIVVHFLPSWPLVQSGTQRSDLAQFLILRSIFLILLTLILRVSFFFLLYLINIPYFH